MPETNIEQSAPTLYQHFQDTEVTVFGITGTIAELSDMCPVPPERRSAEAMDKFTAKVLESSGIEIPEQFRVTPDQNSQAEQRNQQEVQVATNEKPAPNKKPATITIKKTNLEDQIIFNEMYEQTISRETESAKPQERPVGTKEPIEKPEQKPDSPRPLPISVKASQRPPIDVQTVRKVEPSKNETKPLPEILIEVSEGESIKMPVELVVPNPELTKPRTIINKKRTTFKPAIELITPQPVLRIETAELPKLQPLPTIPEFLPPDPQVVELLVRAEQTKEPAEDWPEEMFVVPTAEDVAPVEEILPAILPESIQEKLVEYDEAAEPEEAIIVKSLTIFLENAVIQLEELATAEIMDEAEIIKTEEAIIEVYDELLLAIGIENEDERQELVKKFITELRTRTKRSASEESPAFIEDNEGTHEHKRTFASLFDNDLSLLPEETDHLRLGRYALNKVQIKNMVAASGLEPLTSGL